MAESKLVHLESRFRLTGEIAGRQRTFLLVHGDNRIGSLPANDIVLKEGLVLAVEPMCNLGTHEVRTLDDKWTVVTADGKASAHYEHTLAVTRGGVEVLTDGN